MIIHYRCEGPCPEVMASLQRFVADYPTQVIAVPEPRLPSPFALTAWERLATLDYWDEAFIRGFVDVYRGRDHHPPTESTTGTPAARGR